MRVAVDGGEALGGAADLACGIGVGELQWVSPNNGGQSGALLIASWQVKRKTQVDAIGALVLDKLLSDATKLRRGVGEVRKSVERTFGVADEKVRCFRRRFTPRQEATSIIAEERHYYLEMVGVALEEALFLTRHWIQTIKKGEIALGGGADDIV